LGTGPTQAENHSANRISAILGARTLLELVGGRRTRVFWAHLSKPFLQFILNGMCYEGGWK